MLAEKSLKIGPQIFGQGHHLGLLLAPLVDVAAQRFADLGPRVLSKA